MEETMPLRARDDVHAEGQLLNYTCLDQKWKIDAKNVTITAGTNTTTHKLVRFIFDGHG